MNEREDSTANRVPFFATKPALMVISFILGAVTFSVINNFLWDFFVTNLTGFFIAAIFGYGSLAFSFIMMFIYYHFLTIWKVSVYKNRIEQVEYGSNRFYKYIAIALVVVFILTIALLLWFFKNSH